MMYRADTGTQRSTCQTVVVQNYTTLFANMVCIMSIYVKLMQIWAITCDFKQYGILTSVVSDEPVHTPFKLRDSKCSSVSSLTVIEYSNN